MQSLITYIALVFSLFVSSAIGLHLEVPALPNPQPVCIRDFVQENQMVVVNIKTDGSKGDGQRLDLKVTDSLGNEYRNKKDVVGHANVAFTSQHNAAIDICLTNYLDNKWSKHQQTVRSVELDIESGAAARDWNALQASEKLKPVEVELKRIESITEEIVEELRYLKAREERMRDTNESTNSRVKWFSIVVIASLVGFGVWQIQYLRHYFKVKHII
ncbi:endoplasmic reticulum vesicle protein 25 [Candida albicans P57072]|uniref:Endoplasmic reticulum vesicle protein 25 n=4 Tax=Candida albicans TaxID=5476 RepID=TMEDA_CANAL|nr:Erv25p [Candida albicans SC5314]Q5A302.1 RecName: Full=Endoplasmic reticulum vesicle protein 25; Flags: Precursor [Candida albicans SC5314]EEQ44661.1 protein ERV25 precursor [Candida albicans WO-1]KAF6072076.1 Endoplasmic reticulum vesicle protein 25 [Candida albicans]KGQ87503.1 endoplasmic reticulum vesicle protein 25 [Candida albicans P94015]KGQ91402.1 endoplasmic reticulum vesicle protein 25 [Candida albicans P37005]KGQ98115.1 endoplasmic reticulum vesicle protein 25 [Candida albicans G|eukprot:XP_716074.1 Erv25p [Candida albicans SC5314]